jgi:hypothetical protein
MLKLSQGAMPQLMVFVNAARPNATRLLPKQVSIVSALFAIGIDPPPTGSLLKYWAASANEQASPI